MNKGKKAEQATKLTVKTVETAIDAAIDAAYKVSTTAKARVASTVQALAEKIHADLPKLTPEQVAQMILDRAAMFLESMDKGKRGSFRTQLNEGLRAVAVPGWADKGLRIRKEGAGRKALTFAQKIAKVDSAAAEDIASAKDPAEKVARAIASIRSAAERIRTAARAANDPTVTEAIREELAAIGEAVKVA